MKNKKANLSDRQVKPSHMQQDSSEENNLAGYPVYPPNEDIYHKFKEEKDINPEDISTPKESGYTNEIPDDDVSGSNLDVPGAELDDNQENVGSEDEENNYYSIGGDDHNDLEEDQGDAAS